MSVHKKNSAQSVQPFGRLYATNLRCLVLLYRYGKRHSNYSPTVMFCHVSWDTYTLIFLPDCSHSNGCPPEGINHTGKLCGSKFFLRHIGQSTVIKQVYSVNVVVFKYSGTYKSVEYELMPI